MEVDTFVPLLTYLEHGYNLLEKSSLNLGKRSLSFGKSVVTIFQTLVVTVVVISLHSHFRKITTSRHHILNKSSDTANSLDVSSKS